jgi:hypothetical protein
LQLASKNELTGRGVDLVDRVSNYDTYSKIRRSIERFFAWMKSFRRIQTRYDRLASSTYLGFPQLGCVMILMRKVSR